MQSIRFYYINYRILDDLEHLILILNSEAKETSALNRRSFTINLYSCNSWHANKQKKIDILSLLKRQKTQCKQTFAFSLCHVLVIDHEHLDLNLVYFIFDLSIYRIRKSTFVAHKFTCKTESKSIDGACFSFVR